MTKFNKDQIGKLIVVTSDIPGEMIDVDDEFIPAGTYGIIRAIDPHGLTRNSPNVSIEFFSTRLSPDGCSWYLWRSALDRIQILKEPPISPSDRMGIASFRER